MLERKIHRMIAAETASGHRQLRRLILPAQKGKQFVQDVTLVLQVPYHPHPRMEALVVPALAINTVRATNLQFAPLNLRRQHSNHAPVFIFKELSHGSMEYQQRQARVYEGP